MKFIFDGTDMYIVSTRGVWNDIIHQEHHTFLTPESKSGNIRVKGGFVMNYVYQSIRK